MPRVTSYLGVLVLLFSLVSPVQAAETAKGDAGVKEAARLCAAPAATVEFSCKTEDDRLVAVCSGENGAMRLVFETTSGADLRMTLPEDPADKADVGVGSLLYSGGGGSYARFKDGDKAYVVYSGFGKGWAQAGLAEVKGEEHLAEHVCLPVRKHYDGGFALLGQKGGYAVDESQDFAIDVK